MIRRVVPAVALLLLLTGCSCQQRLKRLQTVCPDCFSHMVVFDTVQTRSLHIDTVAPLEWHPDGVRTVSIERPDVRLEISIADDQASVSVDIPPDTVVVERSIQSPIIVKREPCNHHPLRLLLLGAILGGATVAFLILKTQHT